MVLRGSARLWVRTRSYDRRISLPDDEDLPRGERSNIFPSAMDGYVYIYSCVRARNTGQSFIDYYRRAVLVNRALPCATGEKLSYGPGNCVNPLLLHVDLNVIWHCPLYRFVVNQAKAWFFKVAYSKRFCSQRGYWLPIINLDWVHFVLS